MKVVQFYETVQVRHGLMIVGTTGSEEESVVDSDVEDVMTVLCPS